MILQALYEYYQRKAADPESNIAPEGLIEKKIDFFIVIKSDGSYVTIDPQQEWTKKGKTKKLSGKAFFVPAIGKQAMKHTMAGDDANLLWDNASFILGLGKNGQKKQQSFIDTILRAYTNIPLDVASVIKFFEKELSLKKPFYEILNHSEYGEKIKFGDANITFKIDGDLFPIIEAEHVKKAVFEYRTSKDIIGNCLISGEIGVSLEPTHWVTKGIVGAQTSGANLVSFNSDAYCSYGKEQSMNAPVSKRAAMGYTKALQYLIESDKNKVRLVDTTTVFWAQKKQKQEDFENAFSILFGLPSKDDPDSDVKTVKNLYDGVYSGRYAGDSTTLFYVLGLAPNAARIAIRFWHVGTIAEFAGNILQHFKDFEITPKEKGHYALFWLLSAMAFEKKVDNVPPNLSGQIVRAVLTGTVYPTTMLQQTIRRVRATRDVTRVQAGILKAYLNRYRRIYKIKDKEKIEMSLDYNNTNPGYRLGRLFAVLEKIQEEANQKATIRERFYGAASSSPITVFPQLLKLKNYHLAKLKGAGRKITFERMLTEIFYGITPEMPSHLAMEDQARFAIGYYHQRQELFTKSSSSKNESENQGE